MDDQKQEPPPSRGRQAGLHAAPMPRDAVRRLAARFEGEAIPRLMLLQQSARGARLARPQVSPEGPRAPVEQDVIDFSMLLSSPYDDAAVSHVHRLLDAGMPADVIIFDLLAPAARRLGALWECDGCDFTSVTIGLWRLQRSLNLLRVPGHGLRMSADRSRSVLMTVVPGEQHTFGMHLVADLFRRDGWDVADAPMPDAAAVSHAVGTEWFAFVGLSIAGDRMVDPLIELIADLRRASANPRIGVMVGGPLISLRPTLAKSLPADLVVNDAREALTRARERWGDAQRVA
jgi:MerR family transcriptional regulator, light-induced transcriptional regulator